MIRNRFARLAIAAGAAGALTLSVAAAPASAATGTGRHVAIATFRNNLHGTSIFTQQKNGKVTVNGVYRGLKPNHYYFTVVYGNGNCDPAQAFPVGPFQTNKRGQAVFNKTVTSTVSIGGTMSMSVRTADNNTDIDKDGKTGPSDVVAVPGKPSVGLIECNYNPFVR